MIKLKDGEPYFVLRAQDKLAPQVVRLWALTASMQHCPQHKVEEARRVAEEMEAWQDVNDCKLPD